MKTIRSTAIELKGEPGDKGEIEGYASTFGNVDLGGDIVMRGAFESTLAKHRAEHRLPAMLWSHDLSRPIGKWLDMREDGRGLLVKGRININTRDGADAYQHAKGGSAVGLSIGYEVARADHDRNGNRLIQEAVLYEVSLVALPMNTQAGVTSVKLMSARQCEKWLRTCGLSRGAALKLTAGGWPALTGEHDQPIELGDAVDSLLASLRGEEPESAQPAAYEQAAAPVTETLADLRRLLEKDS
jgi:uncharacterized protein